MTKKTVNALKYNVNNQLINADALYVIENLQKKGYDGYIVGGGIRDLLLGKKPKDFDIVTNAHPEIVRKLFRRNAIIIGRRFKIVHVFFENINPDKIINHRPIIEKHIIEVSTYRNNEVHHDNFSEHGRIVTDNEYGTQKQDALRRDFTINTLYYDPVAEKIIDYHNGLKDIENKTLTMIGEPRTRYIEDPVRILRAIRLAAKLNLVINKETLEPINEVKHLLSNETRGRRFEEMLKILLCGNALKCIDELIKLRLSLEIFPLLDSLFFKTKKINQIAKEVLLRTDLRIQEGNDVSIVFVLAGLMWHVIYKDWHINKSTLNAKQALLDSIIKHRPFAANTIGITKAMYIKMADIWMLQFEFEVPKPKKINNVLSHPRFRQAWHLYTIRYEVGEVDAKLYLWWKKFIESDSENQNHLLEELKQNFKIQSNRKKKKNKRKKKKSLTGE